MASLFATSAPPEHKPKPVPQQKRVKDPNYNRKFEKDTQWANNYRPPADEHETWFRHTNWKIKRGLVREALVATGQGRNAVDNFDNCGADCMVEWSEQEQRFRLRANYCKCRHCEPCMRAKANLLSGNLRKKLEAKANGRYRFITLTMKHNTEPLADQIKRLYRSFAKLRTSRTWKKTQRGGAAVLEVKWQADTRRWHPHLHIVTEGDFLAQRDLSAAWFKATGDSHIVDIRQLASERDAAHYVSKYVTKGTTNDVWRDENAAQEWVTATKGVRTCSTFGTWRGFALLKTDKTTGDWAPVEMLKSICERARRGNLQAVELLMQLEDAHQYDPHKKRPGKPEKSP